MPAFRSGKNGFFSITDTGAVVRDLSTFLKEIDFPRTVDMLDVTAFGGNSKSFIVGLMDSKITISGSWDGTATTAPDAVLAPLVGFSTTTPAFVYKPSTVATVVTYSGSCFVTSFDIKSVISDVVSFTAEFQITGDVTRA